LLNPISFLEGVSTVKSVRIVLALVLALSLSATLLAGERHQKREAKAPVCPAGQRIEKLTEGMTLTDDQKAKLGTIGKEYGPKMMDAMKAMKVLTPEQEKTAAEATKAAKAQGKKGRELHDAAQAAVTLTDDQKAKKANAESQLKGLTKDLTEKVKGVLTPEQAEQLKKNAHGRK
jgi:Spy/CpxP family protein refolding chaperone